MRAVKMIMFIVDANTPSPSLDQILEAGAAENGYTAKEFTTESVADAYWKLKKE